MTTHPKTLLAIAVLLLLQSCRKEDNLSSDGITNIFIMGASRVEGNAPEHESFRYDLWKKLTRANVEFDFIGNKKDPKQFPKMNGKTFDPDHQGSRGFDSRDLQFNLDKDLATIEQPDIVIFSSPGGNDIANKVPLDVVKSNIRYIVKQLQNKNPKVTVILEKMAPGNKGFMNEKIKSKYEETRVMIDEIKQEFSKNHSPVITIDMAEGFSDDFIADNVHYNKLGANFIASKYFELLEPILSFEE